jgi:hypothetical protein
LRVIYVLLFFMFIREADVGWRLRDGELMRCLLAQSF